jgi:hypothetical protein
MFILPISAFSISAFQRLTLWPSSLDLRPSTSSLDLRPSTVGCSCWLLAVGCWLLAVGCCWLLAVGCWMFVLTLPTTQPSTFNFQLWIALFPSVPVVLLSHLQSRCSPRGPQSQFQTFSVSAFNISAFDSLALALNLTPHASRPTPHAPRPTPHAPRPTPHAPRPTPHATHFLISPD